MRTPVMSTDRAAQRTRETRELHPQDVRLRAFGWRILERSEHGPPLWSKEGRILAHDDAMAEIDAEIAKVENAVEDGNH